MAISKNINKNININAAPPQMGSVTNHHDQLITLHSFNIINAVPNNVKKLIPLVFLLLIFF